MLTKVRTRNWAWLGNSFLRKSVETNIVSSAVCKETLLSNSGTPFKPDIIIFLSEEVPKTLEANTQHWHPLGTKQKNQLKSWDQRRGSWHITLTSNLDDIVFSKEIVAREISPVIQERQDTNIPTFRLEHLSQRLGDKDEASELEEEIQACFEWVGMACLGSQRCKVVHQPKLRAQANSLNPDFGARTA